MLKPSQGRSRIGKALFAVLLTGLLLLASLITSPGRAIAQALPATAEAPILQSDLTDIAADKIDRFAQTYLQVLQLLSDREPELPAAETSAEALKIQQSIESEAIALIEKSGLTMPEYMQILGIANQDIAFRDKVLGRMDESLEK